MYSVVKEIVDFFGLYYIPTNFGDLIMWFVLVMCAVCIVCSMIKLMLYISTNIGRLAK